MKSISDKDIYQSNEYSFPYHYIPSDIDEDFPKFCVEWGFSASYLAALRLLDRWFEKKKDADNQSHLDVGCGDGRLINEFAKKFTDIQFLGFDYDNEAIKWAEIFKSNNNVTFYSEGQKLEGLEKFNTISLIEVIEHVAPKELSEFLSAVDDRLQSGGEIFVTVPSIALPVSEKHYQHFDVDSLKDLFAVNYENIQVFGFEKTKIYMKIYTKFRKSKFHYFESAYLNRLLVQQMSICHSDANNCVRLVLTATKR